MLCLQIWAEATRDPAIAALHAEFDQEILNRIVALFRGAKARGEVSADCNCTAAARISLKLADGLFVRRAAAPDFDPEQEIAEVFAVIEAMLDGSVALPSSPSSAE